MKITKEQLDDILKNHKAWVESEGKEGERIDFRKADLRKADFREADLRGANLKGADLGQINIDKETMSQFPDTFRKKYEHTWITEDELTIKRSIEFPPEYYQAGMSILIHFGSLLKTKYPDTKAKIKIEQEGLKVTMTIDPVQGEREEIERELDKYGLVVTGKMTPEEYAPNDPLLVIELESQLNIAKIQVENQRNMLLFAEKRIQSLEQDVQWLRNHIGSVLTHSEKVASLSEKTMSLVVEELKKKDIQPLEEEDVKFVRNQLDVLTHSEKATSLIKKGMRTEELSEKLSILLDKAWRNEVHE